jgi:hypothetical protein
MRSVLLLSLPLEGQVFDDDDAEINEVTRGGTSEAVPVPRLQAHVARRIVRAPVLLMDRAEHSELALLRLAVEREGGGEDFVNVVYAEGRSVSHSINSSTICLACFCNLPQMRVCEA